MLPAQVHVHAIRISKQPTTQAGSLARLRQPQNSAIQITNPGRQYTTADRLPPYKSGNALFARSSIPEL